ncbi:LTA synthase family protein [Iodobacter fluviatilis]|nr:alkaline phosphatase family protein [Iodobacter fluviatilis]
MSRSINNNSSLIRMVLAGLLVGLIPLSLVRLWTAALHGSTALLGEADFWQALLMGFRFDLKIWAVVWILFCLLALVLNLAGKRSWLASVGRIYFGFGLAVINLLAVCNHFYYGYYRSPFNPIVFGLLEDDTWVVLKTIWQDYSVIRILLGVSVLVFVQLKLWKKILVWAEKVPHPVRRRVRWPACAGLIVLLALSARGSLASQPLNPESFAVSSNRLLCDLVPNGPIALHAAWVERQEQIDIGPDVTAGLQGLGFASPVAAAQVLGWNVHTDDEVMAAMFRKTAQNDYLLQHPPHVVMSLMESWGMQAISRQAADNDVLGRMAKHTGEDYWFTHFASGRRGTHPSLENLLINTPLTPLTQGSFGSVSYASSAAKPYKDAGYRTILVFGGSGGWRRLQSAFSKQYFDDVLDMNNIKAAYPEASVADAGLHDEYLFRFAFDTLQKADAKGQKVMMFILSTTNHPPFVPSILPKHYVVKPINMAKFNDVTLPPAEAKLALQAFQYSSDALGGFIDQIKASGFADKTLLAASGDHHLRSFFKLKMNEDLHWLDRVPLYLRIPPAYRFKGKYMADKEGGHRDIFPTLYAHSLSGASYPGFGEDMLSSTWQGAGLGDFNDLYTPEGVAVGLEHSTWLHWNTAKDKLLPLENPPAALQKAVQTERARLGLQDWMIRVQAVKKQL